MKRQNVLAMRPLLAESFGFFIVDLWTTAEDWGRGSSTKGKGKRQRRFEGKGLYVFF